MIPFRDNIPSRRFPIWTVAIILVNCLLFFYEFQMGYRNPRVLNRFLYQYGMVPARFLDFSEGWQAFFQYSFLSFFTSTFLHGGLLHLIGNMWYLWIFGDNVEDLMGRWRFPLFYLTCGWIAGWMHLFFNAGSPLPSIGASGAIAGVLGAYLVSYPRARILTLVPIFFFLQIIELPAIIVLGFWFLIQFFNGTAAIVIASETSGGVAWWAHIGGFIAGIFLVKIFSSGRSRAYYA